MKKSFRNTLNILSLFNLLVIYGTLDIVKFEVLIVLHWDQPVLSFILMADESSGLVVTSWR
jgi:hypothetical protein